MPTEKRVACAPSPRLRNRRSPASRRRDTTSTVAEQHHFSPSEGGFFLTATTNVVTPVRPDQGVRSPHGANDPTRGNRGGGRSPPPLPGGSVRPLAVSGPAHRLSGAGNAAD